jgi:hypothetical protein
VDIGAVIGVVFFVGRESDVGWLDKTLPQPTNFIDVWEKL